MAKTSAPPAPRRGLRRRLGLITRAPSASSSSSSSENDECDGAARRSLSPAERPRKGVTYARDGAVVCCRFCEILRSGDADFVYEDNAIAVFRPLAPVVESHVLVVPRCHIRNINQLTRDHAALLRRMRAVAELVLRAPSDGTASGSANDIACKFAFHKPPFNSIDHVHMHAFRTGGSSRAVGYFGAIKYRTETWWCRSFEEVLGRVAGTTSASSTPSSSSLSSSSSSSSSKQDQKLRPSPRTTSSPIHETRKTMSEPWRLGDQRPRALV